jgi:2-desacetyl-2-hydroxyethyl bacteriochlorophyllide A dehydrogenase
MNQVVLEKPGQFALREAPDAPRAPGEALVRVRRIGVCGTDIHAFHGRQPFFDYPRVLGHELGVEVLEAPRGDHGLRPGDLCSVEPYLNCGECIACRSGKPNCCERLRVLGVHIDGGMQDFLSVPVEKLHPGKGLTLDQLALVETLGIGAHGVERAGVREGEFVLVIGAGPIGLSVLPFAMARGARVAVMDISAHRLAFCREHLGVAMTIHPGEEDAAARLREFGGGDLPTAVIDATGNPQSMQGCFELAAHGGRIVFVGLFPGEVRFDDPNFHRRELTLLASRNALPSTFDDIIRLILSRKIDTSPWITHRFALAEAPARFAEVTAAPGLVKAMIEVS